MSATGRAWVDGRVVELAEATIPLTDRGFLLGDGIFDSVRTYGRRPFLLGDHLDRLRRSAAALWLDVPWSDPELTGVADALLDGWDGEEAVLRFVVTRGDGGHGLLLPEVQRPRLVVLARPMPRWPDRVRAYGIRLSLPTARVTKDNSVPAHVKSANYLAGVLALREARAQGAAEALLRAPDGTWAEATTSNLFCVHGDRILTPGEDHVLPGVTRALTLAVASAEGLEVRQGPVNDATLHSADEVFITSSVKEVVPVVGLNDAVVADGRPGPVTTRLIARFGDAVQRIQAAGAQRLTQVFGG